jgi:hypothetical protein
LKLFKPNLYTTLSTHTKITTTIQDSTTYRGTQCNIDYWLLQLCHMNKL